jgi:hydrogenase maturation protease
VSEKRKIIILGIGNLLLKDEGVGIHLIQLLEKESLPPGVELVDGGTSTLDVLPLLKEADKIIVVDAMRARGAPGSIYRCRPQDLTPSRDGPLSLCYLGFIQTLKMAKLLGDDLESRTIIFGVEPQEIGWEIGLTPPVQENISLLKKLVIEEAQKDYPLSTDEGASSIGS